MNTLRCCITALLFSGLALGSATSFACKTGKCDTSKDCNSYAKLHCKPININGTDYYKGMCSTAASGCNGTCSCLPSKRVP